jgi:hypothetical protein
MTPDLEGYQPGDVLHESPRSVAIRAVRLSDARPVVIKLLAADLPGAADIARFRREFQIGEQLAGGAVRSLHLESLGGRLAIIMEDIGGRSLRDWASDSTHPLAERVRVLALVARALADVHSSGIIHKDVNPSNVVVANNATRVALIDFGLSTEVHDEGSAVSETLEGTLAYISPEQTGRMNRPIDHRTDLYSFGVMMYEVIVGRLPFESNDPLEMVHAHLAWRAVAPAELLPEVPLALSRVTMRLLEKNAEDRYRTARGLAHDLGMIAEALAEGRSCEGIVLGEADVSEQFALPATLYGREDEIATVLRSFDRVAEGAVAGVFVSGVSGAGKTAVIGEVRRPIVGRRGLFVSGKCELLQRSVPYLCLTQAFSDAIRQLLSLEEDTLDSIRARVVDALGPNGAAVTEIVPSLRLLVGIQEPVEDLPPDEAEVRLRIVFQRFVRALTADGRPLVLFIDDLQWIDSATLSVLEAIATDGELSHLLLIGAYRDNEVQPDHPLHAFIERVGAARRGVDRIQVGPLDETISRGAHLAPHRRQPLLRVAAPAGAARRRPDRVRRLGAALDLVDRPDQGAGSDGGRGRPAGRAHRTAAAPDAAFAAARGLHRRSLRPRYTRARAVAAGARRCPVAPGRGPRRPDPRDRCRLAARRARRGAEHPVQVPARPRAAGGA